jgi:membrane protease YdiL (CAAX protease family)
MAAELSGSTFAHDPLLRILIGFLALWFVLDRSAAMLGSFSGEAGMIVCVTVLLMAVIVERILFGIGPPASLHALGFRRPERDAVRTTFFLCAALLAFYPLFSLGTTLPLGLADGWPILLIGLFLQGGIAEEVVFRGYLFRHMRRGRSFWRAAFLAALPFIAVHLLLFATLDFPLALAALVVSVSLSFPLAWLFDRSGGSVWPPAILHFTVQGSIKLVTVPKASSMLVALAWMTFAALLPWLVFLLRPRPAETPSG